MRNLEKRHCGAGPQTSAGGTGQGAWVRGPGGLAPLPLRRSTAAGAGVSGLRAGGPQSEKNLGAY